MTAAVLLSVACGAEHTKQDPQSCLETPWKWKWQCADEAPLGRLVIDNAVGEWGPDYKWVELAGPGTYEVALTNDGGQGHLVVEVWDQDPQEPEARPRATLFHRGDASTMRLETSSARLYISIAEERPVDAYYTLVVRHIGPDAAPSPDTP